MIRLFPEIQAGLPRDEKSSVEQWVIVAWLMAAEGRAYAEDLRGGGAQPQMQQAAKLRLLEVLSDVDTRLSGRRAPADPHCLALALEYGLHHLIDASGTELIDVFGLGEEFGGESCEVAGVLSLWESLVRAFPGVLPDRLVAQGQRDMLRTFRTWADLCRSVGLDVGLLGRYLKDA